MEGGVVERARARLIARVIDLYIGVHHGAMYRRLDGGVDRRAALEELMGGFDVLEKTLPDNGDEGGGYALGGVGPSLADAALIGNLAFYDFHLRPMFGIEVERGRPKVGKWMGFMREESEAARGVYGEVWGSLEKWWRDGRYEKLGIKALVGACPSRP